MIELEDGKTLATVIELARATKVVLDRERVAPLSRLWCLYEIGSTPLTKLQLVTHGFSERDISEHLHSIDAETALCFSVCERARRWETFLVSCHPASCSFCLALACGSACCPPSVRADCSPPPLPPCRRTTSG